MPYGGRSVSLTSRHSATDERGERAVDAVIERGLRATADLRALLAATMADVVAGRITPAQANRVATLVVKVLERRSRGQGDAGA